ncbi:hypothetical protein RRG08_000231 [Elysia crispata]|uniref:Uncharacterized protein n=1 Tax=Elysia crispata TaxID=231223 RepID=A0AAE1E758_9GAST|nr:hypothetical protein RRG08_000231 [Elysia crispata]
MFKSPPSVLEQPDRRKISLGRFKFEYSVKDPRLNTSEGSVVNPSRTPEQLIPLRGGEGFLPPSTKGLPLGKENLTRECCQTHDPSNLRGGEAPFHQREGNLRPFGKGASPPVQSTPLIPPRSPFPVGPPLRVGEMEGGVRHLVFDNYPSRLSKKGFPKTPNEMRGLTTPPMGDRAFSRGIPTPPCDPRRCFAKQSCRVPPQKGGPMSNLGKEFPPDAKQGASGKRPVAGDLPGAKKTFVSLLANPFALISGKDCSHTPDERFKGGLDETPLSGELSNSPDGGLPNLPLKVVKPPSCNVS